MGKYKYINEFEFNSTLNVLYPYISTPSGLESWFAEKVEVENNEIYNLVWDGENHFAHKVGGVVGRSIKFDFLDKNKQPVEDPNSLEFILEKNDFSGMVYLKVIDYSENQDDDDLFELWSNLVEALKTTVVG